MAYDGTLKFNTKIDTAGFNDGIKKISSIAGAGMKATTAVLGVAATAVAVIGTAAIKVGMDFDSGMSKVKAISGATDEQLQQLRDKAIEMGDKTKYSATESAEAFKYMAMAGWKTEDMLNGIEGIMNLAAASGEDLARVSDIVTDALTAFGLSASDSSHFADVLAKTAASSNTNVGMLGESFKYVAPVAGALGMSVEDTSVALGLMANAGIKASQSGTYLRAILANMAQPTDTMAAAMDALGVSLENDDGSMKSLMEVMQDLRKGFGEGSMSSDEFNEKLAKLNAQLESGELNEEDYQEALENLTVAMYGTAGAEKAKYAAMLAGKEAMPGLLAIVNASEEDFHKLTEEIANCTGAAEEMAETMNDNLAGQLTILRGQLETFGIALSESVQEPLKDVVKEAQTMVSELKTAFSEGGFEGLIDATGDVLAQAVQMIMDAAPQLIETAKELCIQFINSIMEHSGEFASSGAELVTTLANAILELSGEMWSAAITLFTQFLAGLAENLPSILDTGMEAVTKLGQALVDNAPSLIESAGTIISTLFDALMEAMPRIGDAGVDILTKLTEAIKTNLPKMIPVALDAILKFTGSLRENIGHIVDAGLKLIMTLADSLIQNLPALIEKVPLIVSNIAGIINDNAPKLLMSGLELIVKLGKGLIDNLPVIIENAGNIVKAIIDVFFAFNWMKLGKDIIVFIKNGIKSLSKTVPEAVKNIAKKAIEFFKNTSWAQAGSNAITAIGKGISGIASKIPGLLKAIGTKAINFFKGVNWSNAGSTVINLIGKAIQGVASLIPKLLKGIATTGFNAFKAIPWGQLGSGIINLIKSGIQGLIHAIPNLLKSIIKTSVNVFKQTDWKSLGKAIVNGVWKGIQALAGSFYNDIWNFFSGIVDNAKSALGINSPSKVFRDEVGKWIPPGITDGIKGSMPKLLNETEQEMKQLADKMQATVKAETSKITIEKTGRAEYEQAIEDRRSQRKVDVTGKLEGDRPIEVHTNLYIDKKKFAKEVTPAINHEMYKIDETDNNRGRGN